MCALNPYFFFAGAFFAGFFAGAFVAIDEPLPFYLKPYGF
jgi:hypothetical protein